MITSSAAPQPSSPAPASVAPTASVSNVAARVSPEIDLLITGARVVATMNLDRREIKGGWIGIDNGQIHSIGGPTNAPPIARSHLSAEDCLVTPGLVNTHHHLYQNLTRAYAPMTSAPLFGWLETLYPLWQALDEEAAYVSAWVGLAELALGGCTTSSDHLYLHPKGTGDLIGAEIQAASELGMRFHPTHGSMSVSKKDGGLPPDSVVMNEDDILAESQRLVERFHDPSPMSMTQVALAPCSPFSVSPGLMERTATLAEQLDVRLHTHLAENDEDDEFSMARFGRRCIDQFEHVGWMTDRSWVAHCVRPNTQEIARLGAAKVGVAHCPSSNMILSSGIAPIVDLRRAGVPVGLGCDGSSSADSASLWQEARTAMLLAKLSSGADRFGARDSLEIATVGGASCLGRTGEIGTLTVGAAADLVCWKLDGPLFAGVHDDVVEGWLRCGPIAAHHTVVAGKCVVQDGQLTSPLVDEQLRLHQEISRRFQPAS